jgi:hypothetical protein
METTKQRYKRLSKSYIELKIKYEYLERLINKAKLVLKE